MTCPGNRKILLITPTLAGGGAERVLLNVGQGFADQGYGVHVVVLKNQLDYPIDQRLHRSVIDWPGWVTKHKLLQNGLLRRFMRRFLARHGPFALILSNYQSRGEFLPAHARSRLFFWVHSDYWSEVAACMAAAPARADRLRRRIVEFFSRRNLIAVSRGAKRSLLEDFKITPARVEVIYNPLHFGRIRKLAEVVEPEIPNDPFILHAARFEPNKRHDLLLDAFAGLAAPCRLVLLTRHDPELEEMIRARGLGDRVLVAGFRDNPYPWMRRARLVVLCSDSGEALPTVLIEALVCGTPVVSTDCPFGPGEVLTGPLARWLVPVNDPLALRTRIDEALSSNIMIDSSLLERFSQEVVMQQYIALISREGRDGDC